MSRTPVPPASTEPLPVTTVLRPQPNHTMIMAFRAPDGVEHRLAVDPHGLVVDFVGQPMRYQFGVTSPASYMGLEPELFDREGTLIEPTHQSIRAASSIPTERPRFSTRWVLPSTETNYTLVNPYLDGPPYLWTVGLGPGGFVHYAPSTRNATEYPLSVQGGLRKITDRDKRRSQRATARRMR